MATFLDQLDAERGKLLAERNRIDGVLAGLDKARQFFLASGGLTNAAERSSSTGQRPSPVRDAVLEVLRRHPGGLSYLDIARSAEELIGRHVNPKSVSSLLSVQAKDGTVIYGDGRYRLSPVPNGQAAATEAEEGPGVERDTPTPGHLATDEGKMQGPA